MESSSMSVELLKALEDLSKRANSKENLTLKIGERDYSAKTMEPIFFDPRPETIKTSSLSSIAEYVKGNIEMTDPVKLFLHVVSPQEVELLEEYSGEEKKRTRVLVARRDNDAEPFTFNEYHETEEFIIGLESLFEPTDDRELILEVASHLISEARIANENDGATMKLQVNKGVVNNSAVQTSAIPNVAYLKPFRTFREIDQPISAFVFRYQAKGLSVELTLIEADGGAWKHTAMKSIEQYFLDNVHGLKVIA